MWSFIWILNEEYDNDMKLDTVKQSSYGDHLKDTGVSLTDLSTNKTSEYDEQ